MGEIEVNEYVRTEYGISKLIEIRKVDGCEEQKIYIFDDISDELWSGDLPNELWKSEMEWHEEKFNNKIFLKHSKQLMELIEVKDLVCFKNKLQNSLENEEMIIHIFDNDTLEEVKQAIEKGEIELLEILTHEQFEQSSYKVGGEDE